MKQKSSSSSIIIIILLYAIIQGAQLLKKSSVQALTMMSSRTTPRVELFFSSADELRKRITFLKSKGVTSFNIVNKSNKDDILQSVKDIEKEFQKDGGGDNIHVVSICAHYSMKYNKSRKMDGAFLQLKDHVEKMSELRGSSKDDTKNEILLITGSGPKGKLCTLTALQRLQKEESIHKNVSPLSMAVAFNPFFPNKQDYEDEMLRLEQKLATGIVSKVYIQFGANLERLQSALQLLTMLQSSSSSSPPTSKQFEICGSIFLPTKTLIAQQKFRPWNGVFLSDEFLSSEDGAKRIVLQMMRLYEEYSAEILIEAPGVRSEKDWGIVESLLKERDELLSRNNGGEVADDNGKVKAAESRTSHDDETNITTTSKRRKTSPTEPTTTAVQQEGNSLGISSGKGKGRGRTGNKALQKKLLRQEAARKK